MHSDSPMFQEQSTRYDTQLIFYIPPRKNPDMRRKWCHFKINTTASFYSWIYNEIFMDIYSKNSSDQPVFFEYCLCLHIVLGGLLMEMKLELIAIPVTDVDRALDFYKDKIGFNLDHDHTVNEKLRFVQMTPPGSACSICFGIGIADNMKPGSIKGLQMVVKDAQAANDELIKRGVDVTDVDIQVWGKFIRFNDPDGNAWTLQELPPRGQFKDVARGNISSSSYFKLW